MKQNLVQLLSYTKCFENDKFKLQKVFQFSEHKVFSYK